VSPHPRRIFDRATTLLFVGALAAPAAAALLRPDAARQSVLDEQRTPAPAPKKPEDLSQLALWPQQFQAWFDDHLGLRDVLLEGRSKLLYFGLGVSPTPSAVIGPDGWLFYAKQTSFESWRGIAALETARIQGWTRLLRDRADWCRARGIVYVAAFTPNKMEVYPDRVPLPYEQLGPTRYDQLNDALLAEPGGWYLDMRAELREESTRDAESDYVYSQRGTHWTARGAIRGALAILRLARAAGLAAEDPPASSFVLRPIPFDDDAWRLQLHLPGLPFEVQPGLDRNVVRKWTWSGGDLHELGSQIETRTAADHLPRLWVVHDSFGGTLRKMMAPFFSHAKFDWRGVYVFDPAAILAFEPDLVVDVHTERVFDLEPPERIAAADEAQRRARFEGGSPPTWTLDPAHELVTPDAGVRVARADGAIAITVEERALGVEFPDAKLDEERTVLIRIDVEVEHPGALYVQWSRQGATEWLRTAVAPRRLSAGRQEVYVEVRDPLARGPIRLIPSPESGTVRIRAAEIRAAGW